MDTHSSLGSNDARQAIRMRSFLKTTVTVLLAVLLMLVWYALDMLQGGPLLIVLAATLLQLLGFFWIFRTGLNLRCADASLTLAQMVAASVTALGAAYGANSGRAIFLVMLVMACLFGALRLRTRTLLIHALYIIAGYAGVIALLHIFRPEVLDLRLELINLLVFGLVMPWFAWMTGYISELRQRLRTAFRTVAESERTLADAQRLAQFGSWTFDPLRREAVWSEETYRIFGLDPKQQAASGADFRALVHEEDRERYLHLVDTALGEGQEFNTEYPISLPSGGVRWVHALAHPVSRLPGKGPVLQGMVMDITQRKADEDQIRQLAHFDALTGLPNRNLLMQLLRHAVAKAERGRALAVLFIDLDGFKAVNDSLGHEVGDALLAAFAQRLSRLLRLPDTAARLGGDEFVVVIEGFESQANVETVAKHILLSALTKFQLNGHDCQVSASIGIALHGPTCADVDLLIKAADMAMYAAKRDGKNGFRFYDAASRT